MSLKVVHIFIIILSIGLAIFFGFWAINDYNNLKNTWNLVWGIVSLSVGFILIPYLIWFILKARRTGLK